MEENRICQSCSMPLENESDRGTNADGTISLDYCKHCFEKGEFIGYQTLEEAIADSVNYAEFSGRTKEEALEHAKKVLPTLKRWKCNCTEECTCGDNCTCGDECTCGDDCNCTETNN